LRIAKRPNAAPAQVDMTREDPVMAQNRIIQFLHVLAYKPGDPSTFMMNLFNGDRDVCYALMEWLLKSLDAHKKRAYLAPYLTEIDVPQDLFADEMVMEIKQSCSNLKEEFIHSHKQLAILEEATQDPGAKKEMIQNLDDERRQLSERVARLEKKLQANMAENFEGMQVVCKRLRRELDDEKALRQKHKDQTESLQSAKRAQAQAKERLEKIRNEQGHMLDGDAVTMLAKLEEDIARKRKQAHEDLPHELAESRRKLAETQSIVSGQSFTEHDVQQLMAQKRRLDQECERMAEEKRNPPAADDKIIMFRQQAGMMERKKEQLLQKLEEERSRKAALDKEIEEKENSFEAMGSMGHMSGDDFRRIKQDFRAKSTQYKRMKAELNELRAEKGVLQRTVAILESRCHDLDGFVQEQERKAGVEGAANNLRELETVAAKKSEYDRRKGMTLQEHSEEVDKIRQIIKEKKQKLAPMIKELRAARGEFQQMDGSYQEQKGMYDQFKLKYDCEFEELETDSDAFR
jgi:intraflagellar transport protein 81